MSTQRYLFIRRSAIGKQEQPTSGQLQGMYAAFNVWKEKFKAEIVDMGPRATSGRFRLLEKCPV